MTTRLENFKNFKFQIFLYSQNLESLKFGILEIWNP